jgi:hypothetical protein
VNGLGTCELCNYAKDAPGWTVTAIDENGRHTAEYITPTGARHHGAAPPLPGVTDAAHSEMELHLSIDLVKFAA